MIPGAGGDPQRLGQRRNGDPVHILCVNDAVEQLAFRPDRDGIGLHILAADVHRRTQRKAKSLALSQCVAHRAAVGTHHLTAPIQKIPGSSACR